MSAPLPPSLDARAPAPIAPPGGAARASLRERVVAWLRARPVPVMMLLSPGIVEYLSGSSSLDAVVLNPAGFVLQLGLNVGLYLPGVLLIREAVVRWQKGWASVLVLGAAYGILEEGVALNTLFDPQASVVHSLGVYGHWMGVNTVWLPGVLLVHMLWSIAVPIFLFGLVFPDLRGRPLLAGRRLPTALAVLVLDVVALGIVTGPASHFFMGWPLLLGSIATIGLLVVLAHELPRDTLTASRSLAPRSPEWLALLLGIALYTGLLLIQGLSQHFDAPPAIAIVGVVGYALAFGLYALRYLDGSAAYRPRLMFVAGTLGPILLIGALTQYPWELVLLGDALLLLLFRELARAPANAALAPRASEPPPGRYAAT